MAEWAAARVQRAHTDLIRGQVRMQVRVPARPCSGGLTAHSSVGFGSLGLSSCCKVWPPPATLTPSSSFLDARPLRPPLRCIKAVT